MLRHWCCVTKKFSCSSSDGRENDKKKPEELHVFFNLPLSWKIKILPCNFWNSSMLVTLGYKQAADNCHILMCMKTETLQFLLIVLQGLDAGD